MRMGTVGWQKERMKEKKNGGEGKYKKVEGRTSVERKAIFSWAVFFNV